LRVAPAGGPRVLGISLIVCLTVIASADNSRLTPTLLAAGVPFAPVQAAVADPTPLEPDAPEPEPPLTPDRLIALVRQTWPEDPETATRILVCESHAGQDAATYDVDAANGGPMQLDRYTWAPFFLANYGWTWDQVVNDVHVHLQAARIVYDRAGGWTPWRCF
jgi:hypothetical protein